MESSRLPRRGGGGSVASGSRLSQKRRQVKANWRAAKPWIYGCRSGKRRFLSYDKARNEMERTNEIGRAAKSILRVYRCGDCAGFHLTSQEYKP